MAAGRTAGREVGLNDFSNARAIRESYGIHTLVTGIGLEGVDASNNDVLGLNAGAGGGDILNVLGTARVADVVAGDDRVTVTGMDVQPLEGVPRRLVWTYVDAALADAVGTITIQGFNSFGDPITETIAFAAGTLTGTTVNFYRRVTQVVVRGAAAVIDIAADTLMLRQSVHLGVGPLDPNVAVVGAPRLDLMILSVQQHIAAGDRVTQTFAALNAAPGANEWQLTAINPNGEGSITLNALDDWGAAGAGTAFYFVVTFRYRPGQTLTP